MGIKKYKPTSPGRRQMTVSDFSELTRRKPEKSLTEGKRSTGGRNNMGRVTVRFRGGGVRRRYRIIDFRRVKDECSATVREIEYDPNRSARIALLEYEDGVKSYIICPVGLNVGDVVRSGEKADFKPGHVHCLKDIPDGRRSARSATSTITASAWARLARSAILASARMSVVLFRTRLTTPWVVVKAVRAVAMRSPRGASWRKAIAPASRRKHLTSSSFSGGRSNVITFNQERAVC